METQSKNQLSDYHFRKAIMSAMPYVAKDRCIVSEQDLFKAASKFLDKFRVEVERFENSGRAEIYRPNMKQKQRALEIEKILCEYIGATELIDKAPIYQVYFIVGVLMSLPGSKHTWWEETFAKGIWEYLGWTSDFKDSEDRRNLALDDIMILMSKQEVKSAPRHKSQNIYVASSWRNPYFKEVVKALRDAGHNVYDFQNPDSGNEGFHWSDVDPEYANWTSLEYRENLSHPLAKRQFMNDFKSMQACDVCVLLLPCGRSAHTEAGWFAGKGKQVYVLIPNKDSFEPELMYKLFTKVCTSVGELLAALS